MFKKITLRNYRTHKHTTIELQPITLLIGNNNSGKTNFLSGVQHFSQLIRRGNPDKKQDRTVKANDYFPHRYRLAEDNDSMSIEIEWHQSLYFVKYYMEVYKSDQFQEKVGCREKVDLSIGSLKKYTFENGHETETNSLELRSTIANNREILPGGKKSLNIFFQDCAYTFCYHFQPSFLKGIVTKNKKQDGDEKKEGDDIDDGNKPPLRVPSDLGYEGENLLEVLNRIRTEEELVFSRFELLMRRFANNRNFNGIRFDNRKSKLLWEFDLGRKTTDRSVDEFPSEVISDGLIKAAAIALLVSIQTPPALILIEEIENGINPGNIQELMGWLWQATAPSQKNISPQFILTSHSPSVLREFYQNLESVYTFRLNKRTYQSDVRNLSQALDILIGIGTVEGEIIEDRESGKRLVEIPRYQLAELWYSGTIG